MTRRSFFKKVAAAFAGCVLARMPLAGAQPKELDLFGELLKDYEILYEFGSAQPPSSFKILDVKSDKIVGAGFSMVMDKDCLVRCGFIQEEGYEPPEDSERPSW